MKLNSRSSQSGTRTGRRHQPSCARSSPAHVAAAPSVTDTVTVAPKTAVTHMVNRRARTYDTSTNDCCTHYAGDDRFAAAGR